MDCPRCSGRLNRTDFGEHGFVVLDVCTDCSGSWFDKGELDRLDDSVWTNLETADSLRASPGYESVKCPKCAVQMTALSASDVPEVIVDRCPSCEGFWLDKDELDAMKVLASKEDERIRESMTWVNRPSEYSWLRWVLHNLRSIYLS